MTQVLGELWVAIVVLSVVSLLAAELGADRVY